MKRTVVSIGVLAFLVGFSALSYAHLDGYTGNIKEGFVEVVKSPLPFVNAVREETKAAEFKPLGVLGGVMKGSFYTLRDISSGIFRILTFNVEDNDFLIEKFGKKKESK